MNTTVSNYFVKLLQFIIISSASLALVICCQGLLQKQKEFDLYASITTAREVGGDFYDFFMIDADHLALVIADVSGKGIPAAMFMMTAKTTIKDYTLTHNSTSEIYTILTIRS